MKKGGFLENLSWTLIAKITQLVAQTLVGMFVGRYLGPDGSGTINYVAAFVTFATSVVSLGVSGVIVNDLCKHKDDGAVIIGSVMRVQAAIGVVAAAFVVIIVSILGNGHVENAANVNFTVIAIAESISLIVGFGATIGYWFQANQLMKKAAIIQLISQLIVVLYKTTLLICKAPVYWFAFSVSLEAISLLVIYMVVFRQHEKRKLEYNKQVVNRILKASAPFLVADMMIFLYQKMDTVMLGYMLNAKTVGYYSAAMVIANMWSLIPAAFLNVMRPLVIENKEKDEALYKKHMTEMFSGLIYVALPFSLMMTFLGKYVIWILYGSEFIPGADALKIIVWYCAFSYIGGGRSVYLICENKNKYVTVFCAWGAVANAVLNVLLIPRYGMIGAAVATLLTQIIANLIIPALYKETREYVGYVLKGMLRVDYVIEDVKLFLDSRKKK